MKKAEKRRSDCFFGMHSDFHASPKDGLVIGATLKEEDIRDICKTLKPDFLQIDCKGHPGYTSYPSKLGNAMPNFALDPLKMWRKVTKEYGIPLYMHFSGVQEVKYCADHPEESSLGADGKLSNFVRLDSNYLDDYFIPQICELVDNSTNNSSVSKVIDNPQTNSGDNNLWWIVLAILAVLAAGGIIIKYKS